MQYFKFLVKDSEQKGFLISDLENHKLKLNHAGFTLIELLMVIAIIGGLAAIFITTFPASQRRSRDTLRRNDLRQYQSALEVYANRNNGFYPSRTTSVQADTTLCNDLGLNNCAADPEDGNNNCTSGICRYFYRSNGTCAAGNACATNYFLYDRLEQPETVTRPFWFACSDGRVGQRDTVPGSGVSCSGVITN